MVRQCQRGRKVCPSRTLCLSFPSHTVSACPASALCACKLISVPPWDSCGPQRRKDARSCRCCAELSSLLPTKGTGQCSLRAHLTLLGLAVCHLLQYHRRKGLHRSKWGPSSGQAGLGACAPSTVSIKFIHRPQPQVV